MSFLIRIRAIVYKELIQLKRDAMTLRMAIMIPLIQLVLFGYAINTNIRDIPVAVVDHSQTALSRRLVHTVSATQVVKVVASYSSLKEAKFAMNASEVLSLIHI